MKSQLFAGWRRSPGVRLRTGNALWIAMGTLLLASVGAATLVRVTRGNIRQAQLVRHEVEARWAAHAALAGFANRVKMRPWSERFTAANAGEYTTTLTYRGHPVSLWARDSVRGSRTVTGVTDVFVKAVDGEVALGVYQRLRVMPASATNPRALRVVRELTVREDLAEPSARDALLAKLQQDEEAAETGAPGADCCARALDDAAARDVEPDEALRAAQGARADEATEKRFRDAMRDARRKAIAGDLAGSVTLLQEAAGIASSGSPAQTAQRRMAAEYALSKTQYTLAIASAEPDRTARLNDAATRLDGLVEQLGRQCVGPSAAYLRAQVQVMQRRPPPTVGPRPASRAQDEEQRARTVRDITQDLAATLRRIAPEAASYEHGTVLASELPAQFERTWNMPVAYSDTFNEIRMVKIFWFFKLPIPWPVLQRIEVTDDRGLEARNLTVSGQYAPHLWLSEGQGLIASDLNAESGAPLVLLDREGGVVCGYKGATPCATRESGGVWLAPGGEDLLIFGNLEDKDDYGYFAQKVKGGPPRTLLRFPPDKMGVPTHDPIAFSPDGSRAAYIDFNSGEPGIRLIGARDFLAGTTSGINAFTMSAGKDGLLPMMAWTTLQTKPYLLVCADPDDTANPRRGKLLLCDGDTGNAIERDLPQGFEPNLILPYRTKDKVALVDRNFERYITFDLTRASISAPTQPAEIGSGPFSERPGRGPNDVVYLAKNSGEPSLYRWDLSSGQPPERLPVPLETGPTKLRRITAPVGF